MAASALASFMADLAQNAPDGPDTSDLPPDMPAENPVACDCETCQEQCPRPVRAATFYTGYRYGRPYEVGQIIGRF